MRNPPDTADTREVRSAPWRWTPARVFALIVAVALVLPGVGVWWGTTLVHDAVQRRAAAGNATTAQALAAQVARQYDDRTANASNLLALVANGAHLDATVADAS